MKALVSPQESGSAYYVDQWTLVDGEYEGNPVYVFGGYRVCEIVADEDVFEVAKPLFWVDCPDNATVGRCYYENDEIVLSPEDAPKPE